MSGKWHNPLLPRDCPKCGAEGSLIMDITARVVVSFDGKVQVWMPDEADQPMIWRCAECECEIPVTKWTFLHHAAVQMVCSLGLDEWSTTDEWDSYTEDKLEPG